MIDKLLNNYKRNEATKKMLEIRISQWQDILQKDPQEIDMLYSKPSQENLGIRNNNISNPIESMMIRVEEQKRKINAWIKDGKEKIKKIENNAKIVNVLLESLDEENFFIITQKHFERKKWNIITHQFNSKYRNEYNEYITSSGIRKKYSNAKKELLELLEEING